MSGIRKRREWVAHAILLPLAIAVLVVPIALKCSAAEKLHDDWDAGSGEAVVSPTGSLEGRYYSLSRTAKLYTDAQYEATTMEVWALRLALPVGRSLRTPIVNVYFDNLRCSAARSYVWQEEDGSLIKLACDRYALLADLSNAGTGRVESQ